MQVLQFLSLIMMIFVTGCTHPVSTLKEQWNPQQAQTRQAQEQPSQKLAPSDKDLLSKLPTPDQAVFLERQQTLTYPTPEDARQHLKTNPNDAAAHRTLADFYGKQHGQFQNELHERREAVRCNPDNPYDITFLGSMLQNSDKPEAIRLLSSVLSGPFPSDAKEEAKRALRNIKAGS